MTPLDQKLIDEFPDLTDVQHIKLMKIFEQEKIKARLYELQSLKRNGVIPAFFRYKADRRIKSLEKRLKG